MRLQGSAQEQQTQWLRAAGDLGSVERSSRAARHAIPVIYQSRQFPVAGGLMSNGPKLQDNYHQAGMYAVRIIKGDRPADLPVMRPSKFNLVVDVTTAKSLVH